MKKTLVCLLAVFAILTATLSASAAGMFLESVSVQEGPTLIEGVNEDEDCEGELIVTPYSKRHLLEEQIRARLELAYSQISSATNLASICAAMADVASYIGVAISDIVISDLFDISYVGCDNHEEHSYFRITLSCDNLDKFVALMHLSDDGWEVVEDAKVENNGKYLVFKVKELSPFAIAVQKEPAHSKPGDTSNTWAFAIIMVVSAAAIVVLGYNLKKKAK